MDSWERLYEIIKWTGLTTNAFAISIGLNRAENLYQIKKGKNNISRDLAEKITTIYCNINKSWLLTGEGAMFSKEQKDSAIPLRSIPYYDNLPLTSFQTRAIDNNIKPLYYLSIPSMSDCNLAIQFIGNSMTPDIPLGSILVLKESSVQEYLPGEIYYIVTENFCTARILRAVENDDSKLRLTPRNTENYDEIFLNKSDVIRLFLIKGVISSRGF